MMDQSNKTKATTMYSNIWTCIMTSEGVNKTNNRIIKIRASRMKTQIYTMGAHLNNK